jgi:hypothetical protein
MSGGAIALLLLSAILEVWLEGRRANSGILFGVFFGLAATGNLALAFGATNLALVAGSAGATRIICTAAFASPGKRESMKKH